jgi:sugar lactone lactonase YvrE
MRAPDGICLDADGHVWVANAIAPECVLVAPGGRIVQTVVTRQPCFARALGGAEGRTLFACTTPTSVAAQASAARPGLIEVAEVATGAAASQPAAGR